MIVLLLGAVYWYAWRPLPKTTGTIAAPLSGPATITRDSIGVPHIQAASIEDALFLQGYVTAQDRLWQMDALRRIASGELSEVIGQATLEIDRESRRLRMRRLAEEHTRLLPPQDQRWIAAYARGVNYFLEQRGGNLPVEFTLLGYEPRSWSMADTIVIGMQMYRDLTSSWKHDIGKAAMLSRGDPKLVSQLYPVRSGSEFQPGSNAWAIGGKHTATGKPILANDPHLEWGFPSTWYLVHLQAPGLNVAGASLPGVPSVIVGHNDRIAWGVTNLHFDVQDLYIERLDPRTGQYVYEGKIEQAKLERELIPVKGAKPLDFTNWVTRHGPVWSTTGTQSLALRWVAQERGRFEFPFIQLNQARNWDEFRSALKRFYGPGQNFVYADVDGNIGYQATGLLPIRRNFEGDLPVDGSTGKFEWEGFIPFEELPTSFNPASGIIVTANQNPFPSDWKYRVNGNFDPGFRAHQIRALLTARNSGWKPEDMVTIQKDVYSGFLHELAQEVVKAADKHGVNDPALSEAVRLLREWNGQMEKDRAAAMLAELVYQQLRRRMSERASPEGPASYSHSMATASVLNAVRQKSPAWFADWNQALVQALMAAVEEGRKSQGRNLSRWKYGQMLNIELKNPVVSRVPYIGKYFDVGAVQMSGASTTVKQTSRRVGPSMRFVADTSDWNRSLNNVTIGQSGQVLSPHYKDQWEAYWSGRSFPMPWTDVEGDVLQVQPGR